MIIPEARHFLALPTPCAFVDNMKLNLLYSCAFKLNLLLQRLHKLSRESGTCLQIDVSHVSHRVDGAGGNACACFNAAINLSRSCCSAIVAPRLDPRSLRDPTLCLCNLVESCTMSYALDCTASLSKNQRPDRPFNPFLDIGIDSEELTGLALCSCKDKPHQIIPVVLHLVHYTYMSIITTHERSRRKDKRLPEGAKGWSKLHSAAALV
jgi:hypothetical protein